MTGTGDDETAGRGPLVVTPAPVLRRLCCVDRLIRFAVVAGAIGVGGSLVADGSVLQAVAVGAVVCGCPLWPLLVWRARVNVATKWPRTERHVAIVTVGIYWGQRVRATLDGSDLWDCLTIYGVETRCSYIGRAAVYEGPGGHRALVALSNGRLRWLRRLHEEPVTKYFPSRSTEPRER